MTFSSLEMTHTHYYYTFGETLSRRVDKVVKNSDTLSCQSTPEMSLVGGGKDFCTYVAKQKVTYAASKTSSYHTPKVNKALEGLAVTEVTLDKEQLEDLFSFTVQVGVGVEEPSRKRLKVQLGGEVSKNELACNSLRELLKSKDMIVDTGLLDETPPTYSPFCRSKTDLFMYHKTYFKHGVVTSATCMTEHDEEDCRIIESGVCEMKNSQKTSKQLHANMLHFTAQLIVQTLKEGSIIDKAVVYGLSIQYDKKCANLYRMTVDLTAPVTTIEDFGEYPLVDAIDIIIYKLLKH